MELHRKQPGLEQGTLPNTRLEMQGFMNEADWKIVSYNVLMCFKGFPSTIWWERDGVWKPVKLDDV